MKRTILFTFMIVTIFGNSLSTAQVSAYTFSQSVKPYGAINTGTRIGTNYQDDDVNLATLPFNFTFNGVSHSTVNVSSNGFLSFSVPSSTLINPISDASSQSIISAFGSDILMGTFTEADFTAGSNTLTNVLNTSNLSVGDSLSDWNNNFASPTVSITAIIGNSVILSSSTNTTMQNYTVIFYSGSIRQSNLGVAPNRICEFEYRNFARNSAFNEGVSFKIRLYETSNKIEILYGAMNVDNINQPLEVGLKGSTISDFNIRAVTNANNWNTSTNGSSINDACELQSSQIPSIGRSFEWTPACSIPQLNATQSNSVVCAGFSTTLSASGATSYSWSNQSSSAQIIVTPTTNTTYTLYGFSGLCTSSFIVTQSVVPAPTLTLSAKSASICRGSAITLSATGSTNYLWSNGSNMPNITVNPTVTTTYTVSTSNGVCSASKTLAINVNNCTSITNNSDFDNIVVSYPNPFTNEITFRNSSETLMNVRLINALGKVEISLELTENEQLTYNTSNLTKGFYFLEIQSKQGNFTKKLIKH